MTPGQVARKLLGRHAKPVGEVYRRIFVDLQRVIDSFADDLPHGAHILDIGGGDGMGTNLLLDRRPDLRVTMIDIAPTIGGFLESRHRDKVTIRPSTSIADFARLGDRCGGIIVTDVVHHVPVEMRPQFFKDLADCATVTGCETLVVKDIAPGQLRSGLSLLSDWYVTGDRHVRLMAADDVDRALRTHFAPEHVVSMRHLVPDAPNYCLVYTLARSGTA
ncbi:MAG TPA: class I SAM-dependent methyltransferase [Hyphomicrobiaceae bacterium]|nr:class I SAM-dependent methyltransferase [Hyphomicrobiaceae bacterium]